MKIVKFEKGESKVTRKLISKFGESIYQCPEVRSIFIRVKFKDGSNLGFRRDEDEDNFDEIVRKELNKDKEE